ncbi:hypothetical protein F8R90_04205 [Nostoc sp. NZL]|nr:hypothetical protein [Nostoc sp. NZL]
MEFQCFISIHLLAIVGAKHIANLTDERRCILQFLGVPCQKYYLLKRPAECRLKDNTVQISLFFTPAPLTNFLN